MSNVTVLIQLKSILLPPIGDNEEMETAAKLAFENRLGLIMPIIARFHGEILKEYWLGQSLSALVPEESISVLESSTAVHRIMRMRTASN